MTIADLAQIAGRTYPARRRTQNLARRATASTTWMGMRGKLLNGRCRCTDAATGLGQ